MKRIAVIGSPGSGKSTFATKLSKKIGIPVYHLDTLFYKPGWVRVSSEEWVKIQQDLVQKDQWIIDGNYQGSLDTRLEAADTVIFLDFPKILCLWRSLKRRWQFKNKPRADRAEGCEEKIEPSFLKFVLTYPREKTLQKIDAHRKGKSVYIFKSSKQLDQFLINVQ